jgi:carboxyl-terminal processing protease
MSMKLTTVRQVLISILIAVIFTGVGYRLGQRGIFDYGFNVSNIVSSEGSSKDQADLNLFWNVWQKLEQNYLEKDKVVAKDMVIGAIRGMTDSLGDPYTVFLPPVENTSSKEDLQGEFGGVGIQLGYIDSTLAVIAPLPGNPAIAAGVKAGDLIFHIKDPKKDLDIDTKGISLPDAVSKIRGPVGQPVTLSIYTPGDKEQREVTLVRSNIQVPSVELDFVNADGTKSDSGTVAHLKVSKFGERTITEWGESVDKIKARKVDGIVLDLRNNPGGYLQRAIDLASEFIPEGVVVKQQGRNSTEVFTVNHKGKLIGANVVVLVNKGSASASEILAGAMRDRLGVKLVGENTFGKGTVQDAMELPGGAGLHVTIAKWLLPNGANIHKEGLKPDVEVLSVVDQNSDVQLIKAIEILKSN